MSLGLILLIVVVLMLVGAVPSWPHSRGWGYGPSGGIGLVLLIPVSYTHLVTSACSKDSPEIL